MHKLPGLDGFTSNYYKKFSAILIAPLNDLFNEVLKSGTIPPSWQQARLIMLPKPGQNLLETKAFCPISVLNQDYRLFASVLSARLNRFIAQYINDDQTGFIPGRDIGDNIRKTINILQYANRCSTQQSCILSLDISKAFDSVEISYLLSTLKHMGFGHQFTNIIKQFTHLRFHFCI